MIKSTTTRGGSSCRFKTNGSLRSAPLWCNGRCGWRTEGDRLCLPNPFAMCSSLLGGHARSQACALQASPLRCHGSWGHRHLRWTIISQCKIKNRSQHHENNNMHQDEETLYAYLKMTAVEGMRVIWLKPLQSQAIWILLEKMEAFLSSHLARDLYRIHAKRERREAGREAGREGEIGITLEKHGELYQLALAGRLHDALSASRTPDWCNHDSWNRMMSPSLIKQGTNCV